MYDLSKYEDGYTGDVIDSVNNVKAIITGQEAYTTGRNGFIGGKFMINDHKTSGNASTFTIPNRTSFTSYPFTVEMYSSIRMGYNVYKLDNELEFKTDNISNGSYNIWSTREGGSSGNGIAFKLNKGTNLQINGTLSSPLVDIAHDININNQLNPAIKYEHIVVCCDNNKQKVYINGQLISETDKGSTSLNNSDRDLRFFDGNYFVKGDLKLVRVYNSVLTNDQVTQNYNDILNTIGGE